MMLRDSSLRIITNSLAFNDVLSNGTTAESGPEVILTGGRVNRKSAILLGPEAESSLDHFHADAAVISGSALDDRFLYDKLRPRHRHCRCKQIRTNSPVRGRSGGKTFTHRDKFYFRELPDCAGAEAQGNRIQFLHIGRAQRKHSASGSCRRFASSAIIPAIRRAPFSLKCVSSAAPSFQSG